MDWGALRKFADTSQRRLESRRRGRVSLGTEPISLKRRSEFAYSPTNHKAYSEKLKSGLSIEPKRPLKTHFRPRTSVEVLEAVDLLGDYQDAAAAHVYGAAHAGIERHSGVKAKVNAQIQWITRR